MVNKTGCSCLGVFFSQVLAIGVVVGGVTLIIYPIIKQQLQNIQDQINQIPNNP